jgi:hypothetical protein
LLHPAGLSLLARGLPVLGPIDCGRARLLAIGGAHLLPLDASRAGLLALRLHLDALGTLRPRLLAFGAHLRALLGESLPHRPLLLDAGLSSAHRAAAAAALGRLRCLSILATIVAARTCRGRH